MSETKHTKSCMASWFSMRNTVAGVSSDIISSMTK